MEDLQETPAIHLIALWIDLNRPQMQWVSKGRPGDWHLAEAYQELINKVEGVLSVKLGITLLETKTVLACREACQDQQELLLFNSKIKNNQHANKIKKHIDNLARGMGEINQLESEHS